VLTLDGSRGEGGGQILRTALGLSIVTGRPFRIEKIRAGRSKPGLLRQHLTAVRAAKEIGDAVVEGDALGSKALAFTPRGLRAGNHRFDIGSAGSATLVLQTILPALLHADAPSTITLEGGTHNPSSPPFPFLRDAFAPLLARMGVRLDLDLETAGFYPAGGGRMRAVVHPRSDLEPLLLLDRGEIRQRLVRVIAHRIPEHVARREIDTLGSLGWSDADAEIEEVQSPGAGNVLVASVRCDHVTEVFTGFGERGVRAEDVARRVAKEAQAWLDAGVPVGEHLADQLILPMALSSGASAFRTVAPSMHLTTQLETVRLFLERDFDVTEFGTGRYEIRCGRFDSRRTSASSSSAS
jgi:RNA 3'-terminal phosphate cyclase (ATP)